MAKLPTLTDAPRVSMRAQVAPTIRPGEAGASFRQQAQIAGQIGQGLMQLRKKQIAESNKVAYSKSNIELTKNFNDTERQMDEEYRTNKPNFDGYAADGMERMIDRRDEILENAPESARESINIAFDEKMVRMEQKFHSKEAHKKSEYAMFETKDQIKLASQDSYQTYDPIGSLDKAKRLSGLVATSSQFDEKGKAVLNNQINDIPTDMLEGVLDREDPSEMRKALADIDDPSMGVIFGAMDPRAVTRTKSKLKRKLEYKKMEGIKEIKGKYTDSITGLSKGTLNPANPEHKQILRDVKNELVIKMGEDGRVMVDNIEAYEMSSSMIKENAFELHKIDPKTAASEITADVSDPLKRAASKGRVAQIIESQRQAMMKEMAKDPATYITKNDSGISLNTREIIGSDDPKAFNDYMNSMDSRYDQMGVPAHQRKYINETLKTHYGDNINRFIDSNDPKSAAAVINELTEKSGDNLYRFYDELGIPEKYAAVSEIKDPDARTRIMSNLMNEKEDIDPRYKGIADSKSDKDIMASLRDNSMYTAIIGQDAGQNTASGRNAEALLKVAQVEYKSARLNGSDHEEAQVKAWERISKGYDIVENGNFPIPVRTSKHQADKVRNFLSNNTKVEMDYVNKYGLNVPEGSNMAEMNESLKEGSFWSYNKKSDSLRLLYYNKGQARYQEARKIDGSPVMVPLEEINQMDDLTDRGMASNARNNIFALGNTFRGESKKKKEEVLKFKVEGF